MQLHFRNRMFDYGKILKIIAIIMFYHIVSLLPYISGYHIPHVLNVDVEQLICSFHEMIVMLTLFSLGVSIIESNIFAKLLLRVNYVELVNKEYINLFFNDNETRYQENLDNSNPFLYSFKTMGLLE